MKLSKKVLAARAVSNSSVTLSERSKPRARIRNCSAAGAKALMHAKPISRRSRTRSGRGNPRRSHLHVSA
eukprot:6658891-Pyramimonas_sp.AAC.1